MKSEEASSDFRPAVRFVVIFVLLYLAGNSIYGIWIERVKPAPDLITRMVSDQVAFLLAFFEPDVRTSISTSEPLVLLSHTGGTVIRVFEGCNGINVMIVFLAFLAATGGQAKRLIKFSVIGLVIIHVTNLIRVSLLYLAALYQPLWFYYIHKYLFTAALYATVFLLWYIWIKNTMQNQENASASE
ncbi:MAG: exosortase family protein XrtF [Cyclobacteriaceae bacterium]|nr:exosortase family protein XrtF [Cyclobacteriaceae bacterium]